MGQEIILLDMDTSARVYVYVYFFFILASDSNGIQWQGVSTAIQLCSRTIATVESKTKVQ